MATKRKKTSKRQGSRKKSAATRRNAAKKRKAPAKKKAAKKKKAPAKKKAAKKNAAKKKKAPAKKKAAKKKAAKKKAAKKKKAPAKKKASAKKGRSIDEYIGGLSGWRADVARLLAHSVSRAAPDATHAIKWGQPVFEDRGPFAYFKAFGNHINFGFWRGADLVDPHGMLEGDGDRMRHVTLRKPEDLRQQHLEELIREAVVLNRDKGDPTKRKPR